ncbi:winged helix-turn-helix domain-containing protein [Haloquadratum walsbyi]|jgi:DNA-binding PadR family transcriptional regulator|uniref:ArsR family transcription regulator n=1 Tax=Haloquadratum walsbyi (strain DSM 16854 / JCM 12705 / C23) TaxID=768065 RepID=G0LNC6_HALWC|nr:winged helix-turn-helix domain-containing protein [Haloquadratum walsbyi]CCC41932.1 ArsR family transcription regulator [Haloquadratum walsbyi C23]
MGLTLTDAKRQILEKLREEPRHGYALADELGKQGPTIYEHMQQLEDAGYIKGKQEGRRKVYSLTERGELTIEAQEAGEE